MKTLKVELKNCYGIASMEHSFDFSECRTQVIYAANGVMKTSFAKTFSRVSEGEEPEERVYGLDPDCKISADNARIIPDQICVIEPYKQAHQYERVGLLVANEDIRKRYEEITTDLAEAKSSIIKLISKHSGISARVKQNQPSLEEIFKRDIGEYEDKENSFFDALLRVRSAVQSGDDEKYSDLKYSKIFNEKTQKLFQNADFMSRVKGYIEHYNSLLEQSHFFKRGVFNPTNASTIADRLEKEGYFKAEHELVLNLSGESKSISTKDDLVEYINAEKKQILDDEATVSLYNEVERQLDGNQDLKDFQAYLSDKREILEELGDLDRFKQRLWRSYLVHNIETYDNLCEKFEKAKQDIKKILDEAEESYGQWPRIVDIFNDRFDVPFKVEITNLIDVHIHQKVPAFKFRFKNSKQGLSSSLMEEKDIVQILSQGEKKALYLLNVIYEIEGRKNNQQKTLYLVDDITDSFDYKNKYATIEYLHELQETDSARLIVLTHNFDFYRTIGKRMGVGHQCRFHAIRNSETNEITLQEELYQNKNPLLHWKDVLQGQRITEQDLPKCIAATSLVREIAGFLGEDLVRETLNKALHFNESLMFCEVVSAMNKALRMNDAGPVRDCSWIDAVQCAADICASIDNTQLGLDHKISLAIAIRLTAEERIISYLDKADIEKIKRNRTRELVNTFNKRYPGKQNEPIRKTLGKVLLMTSSEIHMNSFMYEPIIDMSGQHLITLLREVRDIPKSNQHLTKVAK